MTKLKSLEILHQNTNKDSNISLHDILTKMSGGALGALLVKKSEDDFDIGWNTELISQLADALAKIEYTLTMVTDDKKAMIEEIRKLSVEFGEANAQIIEKFLLIASENEALARKITSLHSELNGNTASISQTMTTLVTDQKALAELVTELDAEFSGNIATINSTLTALATADSAMASDITTLEASVASNTAAITSESTARATADSAIASNVTTIEARLNTGDFATVKTQSSTTASKVAGIEAKWGVTTNVNGYVAGIQLLNGGSTSSSFTVDATKFIVKKPNGTNGIEWNGSTSVLTINGDVYANAFYGTGVIGTGNVAGNAITNSASTSGGSTPISVGITTTGGSIFIWATVRAQAPALDYASVYVNRDGGGLQGKSVYGGDTGKSEWLSFAIKDTPSAGYHTYSLTGNYTAYDCYLMIMEAKR